MNDIIKQFNIRLPENTLRQLKAKCALSGFTQQEVGEEFVRAYLDGRIRITRRSDGKIKLTWKTNKRREPKE
ncbi:MAG: hypothetical protein PHR77_13650 [Kiritimatiellae bacterium]|nr:hypothetical protein [Kiritimatiellia bacterium]MDD5520731.1 hypothetical protein [Kiritimatiellia bacterium]